MAYLDICEFFKSQGAEIHNDAADFVGTNGCYYHRSKGNTENKHKYLPGQSLVTAPSSEGIISSDLWIQVQKKIMASQSCQPEADGKADGTGPVESEIAKLTAEAVSPEQIDTVSNHLDDWENVSFEGNQQVVEFILVSR